MLTKQEKEKQLLFTSLRLMICVGHADGWMGEKEVSRIYEMVDIEPFSLRDRQMLMSDIDDPKCPETIVADMIDLTQTEKLTILRKLYHIALIDRKLSAKEETEIKRIACLLGISQEKQQEVEEWVYDGIKWRGRWQQIVGE